MSFNLKFLLLFICFPASFVLSYSFDEKKEAGSKIIQCLTEEEHKSLGSFFHNLYAYNELAYTLFGDKPISFCYPHTLAPCFSKRDLTYKICIEGLAPLFKGFAVWKKISSKTCENNYILVIPEKNNFPIAATLINKKAFYKAYTENIDLFRGRWGEDPTALLQELKFTDKDPFTFFNDELLLGIMLGYGRHNAEFFLKRKESSAPAKSETSAPSFLYLVTPVSFAADLEDPETKLLVEKYDRLHRELSNLFKRDDWLEIVVGRLLSK